MATFLNQKVLGTKNVTAIYTLEPMTHVQTASELPDMAAFETMQQFAMLNQMTLSEVGKTPYTANSYSLNASYGPGSVPVGVATPNPLFPCPDCQGLDFNDQANNNESLVSGIIKANAPGLLRFLGAVGDREQPADQDQPARRI